MVLCLFPRTTFISWPCGLSRLILINRAVGNGCWSAHVAYDALYGVSLVCSFFPACETRDIFVRLASERYHTF